MAADHFPLLNEEIAPSSENRLHSRVRQINREDRKIYSTTLISMIGCMILCSLKMDLRDSLTASLVLGGAMLFRFALTKEA